MNKKLLIALLVICCFNFSCNNPTDNSSNIIPIEDDTDNNPTPIPNQLPTTNIGLDRSIIADQEIHFNAIETTDQDGEITDYHWDFGDASSSTEVSPYHTYSEPGTYNIILTVTDNSGGTSSDSCEITVVSKDESVYVEGRKVIVNSVPFYIKGVCWSPLDIGATLPGGINYTGYVEQDAPLMAAAGINVVRSYMPITDRHTLDIFYAHGIYIINTVYYYGGHEPEIVIDIVNQIKDHPAILMWCIGNEWNDNFIYSNLSYHSSISKLNSAAEFIKSVDITHPITTVYATTPPLSTIESMPKIDIWGLNYYLDLGFEHPQLGNVFLDWEGRSEKPMFVAEYGADSWNASIPALDEDSQAYATRILTQEIWDNSVVHYSDKVCSGGVIFEWCDEWWKEGSTLTQDIGGISNNFDGPYPDAIYNEEYWGITDIYRNPRPAYYELQNIYTAID